MGSPFTSVREGAPSPVGKRIREALAIVCEADHSAMPVGRPRRTQPGRMRARTQRVHSREQREQHQRARGTRGPHVCSPWVTDRGTLLCCASARRFRLNEDVVQYSTCTCPKARTRSQSFGIEWIILHPADPGDFATRSPTARRRRRRSIHEASTPDVLSGGPP
eukprot:scaffold81991_cov72-Phaeocystis_antarctica.AAC.3